MPKISFVIPVYKVAEYLPRCLDSVLAQIFTDWEAICVNDGSPDECGKILQKYATKDNRFKVVTQKNQGLSMARNNGLKRAKGKYVLFLDSDDYVHPQLLELCYKLAEKENADMVSFTFETGSQSNFVKYDKDKVKYKVTEQPLNYQKKKCKWKVSVNACTKFYNRSLLKGLQFIKGITYEDYPYTYAVLARHPKSILLNLPLYLYEYNPSSISKSSFSVKNIQDYHTGLCAIIKVYENASVKEQRIVKRQLFPNILKQQLNRIERSPLKTQANLYKAFAKELKDLHQRGWLQFWGHKIGRYLKYRKIMETGC